MRFTVSSADCRKLQRFLLPKQASDSYPAYHSYVRDTHSCSQHTSTFRLQGWQEMKHLQLHSCRIVSSVRQTDADSASRAPKLSSKGSSLL